MTEPHDHEYPEDENPPHGENADEEMEVSDADDE
jgi:hypothetical protein